MRLPTYYSTHCFHLPYHTSHDKYAYPGYALNKPISYHGSDCVLNYYYIYFNFSCSPNTAFPLSASGPLIAEATWRKETGQKLADSILVLFVLGILFCRNELGEPGRGLEKTQIGGSSHDSPVDISLSDPTGPCIQHHPKRLLSRSIRMSTRRP